MVEPDDRRAIAAADLVHQADAKPHGSDGWTDPRVIQNRDQGVDDHHTNGIVGLAVLPEGFDQPLHVVETETPTQLLLLPISGINQPVFIYSMLGHIDAYLHPIRLQDRLGFLVAVRLDLERFACFGDRSRGNR